MGAEIVSTNIADSTTVAGTTITDPEPVTQESIVSQTLPPQILDELVTSTLAPSTVGFFPTLPTTDDIPEEVDETVAPVSTTLSTSTTTTVSPRLGLFKTAGRKRFNFRPRLQVQREENNEVGEAEKEKPRFRAVKVPRR